MIIKRIILHKYKRFSLKEVETFDFEPDSSLTIFKWGNGVGKSSLMQQLNPLPPEMKKDFHPDGFKEIHIEHLGRKYVLISKEGKHYFIEDGIELNPGGTKKAQLELIEEKFKLTPNMINVVNGYNRFTLMSPSERKYWLTKISSTDYTYVIGVYNKLLEFKRDNSGTIKNSKEELSKLEKEILDIGNIDNVVVEQNKIKDVIEDLLKSYIHTKTIEEIDPILDNLRFILSKLNSNKLFIDNTNLEGMSLSKIEVIRDKVINKLDTLNKEEETLVKEFNLLSKPFNLEELNRMKDKIDTLTKELKIYKDLENELEYSPYRLLSDYLNKAVNIKNSYEEFKTLLGETDIKNEELEDTTIREKLDNNNRRIGEINVIISKLSESTDMINNSVIKNIKCDSCGNVMPFSNVTDGIKTNIDKLDKELSELKTLNKRYNTIIMFKDKITNIKSMLSILDNISNVDKVLSKIVNSTFKEDDYKTLSKLPIVIDTVKSCYFHIGDKLFPSIKELEDTTKVYKEEYIKYETINKIGKDKLDIVKKRLEELVEERKKTLESLKSVEEFYNSFSEFTTLIKDIEKMLKRYNDVKKESSKLVNNKIIELLVADLKVKLKELSTLIDKRKELETKIKFLTNNIISKEDNNKDINLLLDILSPSNGLIAKSVNSFIGKLIQDMNLIINSVWSYKMKLLKCEISETSDLDYKFKVEVNDSFIVEDISKLSSSMQEIVDLAFRLIFIKYMEFNGIPIILDEFGRTMDQEHRIQAFNMIDEVICKTYDQVFLVSHFEEMYGRFKNASFPEIK